MKKPIILLSGPQAGGKSHIANAIKQQFDKESVVTLTHRQFYAVESQPNLFRHILLVDINEITCATPAEMEVLFDSIRDLTSEISSGYDKPIFFLVQSQIFYRLNHESVTEVECHYVKPNSK